MAGIVEDRCMRVRKNVSCFLERYFVLAPVRCGFLLVPDELHRSISARLLFVVPLRALAAPAIPAMHAGVEEMARPRRITERRKRPDTQATHMRRNRPCHSNQPWGTRTAGVVASESTPSLPGSRPISIPRGGARALAKKNTCV